MTKLNAIPQNEANLTGLQHIVCPLNNVDLKNAIFK